MKKIFSLIAVSIFLVSCSTLQSKAEDTYMMYRQAWRDNKISDCVSFWHPAIVKDQRDIIITKQQYIRDELGGLAKTESIQVLGAKTLKTFVFSGAIFNDVVELDVVIRINKIQNMNDRQQRMFKSSESLVIRELVFMCDFEGQMKIIQSQERQ